MSPALRTNGYIPPAPGTTGLMPTVTGPPTQAQGPPPVLARLDIPAGAVGTVTVVGGPRLLSGVGSPSDLATHRRTWPAPPELTGGDLLGLLRHAAIRGRGGAGFPLAVKVESAMDSGRRRELVVNGAEGEPASAKDSALLLTAPHMVLDGAEVVAQALGVRTAHLVLPADRPGVVAAARGAVAARATGRRGRTGGPRPLRWVLHRATGGFVGGQARAVVELVEGRPNLPVTAWVPESVRGVHGRPTLVSNVETFAQVALLAALGPLRYARRGTPEEPGTTLLTVGGDGEGGGVVEVPHGVPLREVLRLFGFPDGTPVLLGGYHGTWVSAVAARSLRVLRGDAARVGASFGAGVVLPLLPGTCPVRVTASITEYLASQSAGRCGPCRLGLPALAEQTTLLAGTAPQAPVRATGARIRELVDLVTGRGACAHPDGTARLVRSLMATFPEEVTVHERGGCTCVDRAVATGTVRRA